MSKGNARLIAALGAACALALSLGLSACGGSASSGAATGAGFKDGTYSGQSSVMNAGVDGDGYVMVDITVSDGKISDVAFQSFLPDDTPKDDDYGKDGAYYGVAQKVLESGEEYAEQLEEAGSLDGVDAISGATYLYDQFKEAAADALSQARA